MSVLSLQDVIIKWLSPRYPLHEIVLARAVIGVILTLIIVRLEVGFWALWSQNAGKLLLRGALVVIANMCYFAALATMPIASAAALFFVAPLLITMLSIPLLGEQVGIRRWIAVLLGLAGVVIMLRPGDGFHGVAVLPLIAALAYAAMQVLTRGIGLREAASVMAIYLHFVFCIVSFTMWVCFGDGRFADPSNPSIDFLFRQWRMPEGIDILLFVSCGLLVTVGGYTLSQAYRLVSANVIAPFEYVALPMAVVWGYLIWHDVPDIWTWVGIFCIGGGGLYVFYRETYIARRKQRR
jgi:S-adenosylmethionine uptake transporter